MRLPAVTCGKLWVWHTKGGASPLCAALKVRTNPSQQVGHTTSSEPPR